MSTADEAMDAGQSGNAPCPRCGDDGWILACVDDMCRGLGYCVHRHCEKPCPDCNADLEREPLSPSDRRAP